MVADYAVDQASRSKNLQSDSQCSSGIRLFPRIVDGAAFASSRSHD